MISMVHDALSPDPEIDASAAADLSGENGPANESRGNPAMEEDRLDGEEAAEHDVEAAQRPIPVQAPCAPSQAEVDVHNLTPPIQELVSMVRCGTQTQHPAL